MLPLQSSRPKPAGDCPSGQGDYVAGTFRQRVTLAFQAGSP